ncbi:MAG: saccharopine dehydrogenase NADP-binding domain-containing protein [Ignavibacteriales bacterium]|nr:saccharopine dehydrogenase NADP-binding domain-containing protein [Ignavibacteriales bacterium]MCF8305859.1 saccharopine dehydrogenase NADP-binding domain-containing protein [Ignavibacteriales bacterium]MCF8315581.1 saccharopine dehydrogenase NADP-binding domain-containing protein [Ignavibacteriales bacterium]MCF8436889.1 saccharopine dehydrogenase NADP-binding domain-containing protein [Ignavibacteriales bacterium]
MKNVLILGGGQSSPYLIDYMLRHSQENDWFINVCDRDIQLAKSRVNGHGRGNAIEFDVNDENMRNTQIKNADIVINLLSPSFQYQIALDALHHGKHVITASYENMRVKAMNKDALRKGILILNEMGLDPGIDLMTAMNIIHGIKENNGVIRSFISYGSGIPAPEVLSNPFRYCVTWNPRNVVMAGEYGAQYKENGKVKVLPYHEVFQRTWQVDVEGIGTLEAYPNRDSMAYMDVFNLQNAETVVRGTLRYPGWSETWLQIVKLGISNENLNIPGLPDKSYSQFMEMFLPHGDITGRLDQRIARFLGISPTGKIMENLRWLGLFSDEKIGGAVKTPADVMIDLIKRKLPLPADGRDMVVLIHEMDAEYPESGRKEKIISTMVDYGVPGSFTAIAKTVGAPAAIAAKLVLNGDLPITGCQIPTHPAIYSRVLPELEAEGLSIKEKVIDL